MALDLSFFDQNDWAHLHDVIVTVTGQTSTQAELEAIFTKMPQHLQAEAYQWRMSDTVWRDSVYTYLDMQKHV
jgi:hypothetical protein